MTGVRTSWETGRPLAKSNAPAAWGPWPPAQERFDAMAKRALATATEIARTLAPDDDPVIEVWMNGPGSFEYTIFGPTQESLTIGCVLIPALGLGWAVLWHPEVETGRLYSQDAKFDFQRDRLRSERTRVY